MRPSTRSWPASSYTALTVRPWDVVAVGDGIREAEPLLPLFEQLVNLIRLHSPQVAIVFDTSIADSFETAGRRL
ncbi:hypothetical protein [Streptomyces europaeiscabiei]|uniref:hypothetical protein n=1 Tax=Streptomyces europaeiscabiei TaxID=146819 RepID=UPI0039A5A831